jgi:DNA-nicking Smr family endonuclease
MSRRPLSDEEHALWSGFVRSITPLRLGKAKPAPKPVAAAKTAVRAGARHEPPPQAKSLPLAPFDRRLKQRVARGRDAIEVRIDLHGMTQREAHAALLRFLHQAQADGKRIALVVTGKGTGGRDSANERGVLRRQVPLWLALPEFRSFVLGFEEAHFSHGGHGALYVRLRRGR